MNNQPNAPRKLRFDVAQVRDDIGEKVSYGTDDFLPISVAPEVNQFLAEAA
jgi:hypothetical protein